MLNFLTIPAANGKPTHRVLWMHGLGASAYDFFDVPKMFGDHFAHVEFIFPNAPKIPVTANMGMVMPAWYDIRSLELDRQPDIDGLSNSCDQLLELLLGLSEGVPLEKTLLIGFSQGGAASLYLGLNKEKEFGGILCLSGYHPDNKLIPELSSDQTVTKFITMLHGTEDPVVQLELGQNTFETLKSKNYKIEMKTYPMGHEVCPDEIKDIFNWLEIHTA